MGLAVSSSSVTPCADPMCPVALMNWMVGGTFHALIGDKSRQRITVLRAKDGESSPLEFCPCATEEKERDEWGRGVILPPESPPSKLTKTGR